MSDESSGTLLARWRTGDAEAAAEMFRRYANRLIALARSRMPRKLDRRVDPEDIVHSVYRSFFVGARNGRYEVERGGDLWRLLLSITLHKLYRQARRNAAGKRSIDREQAFGSEDSLIGIQPQLLARTPSPLEAAALLDELQHIMRTLEPVQRNMLELRLQGHDLEEIARLTGRCESTVRRVLEKVKRQLRQQQTPSVDS